MESRNSYIDIIKAIGIISVVLGHCVSWKIGDVTIHRFVYLYHLMIFFFVAGYCFKEEYENNASLYIGKKITNLLPLFVAYSAFFSCIHNVLNNYTMKA